MSKMSTDLVRYALNGPTMGTRWTALFYAAKRIDGDSLRCALQRSVDAVDRQMSTWQQDSDLMQLNRMPVGQAMQVPVHLASVLKLGLDIGRASNGAFDIGMGDAVTAWGFGPEVADREQIQRALRTTRTHAYLALEIEGLWVHKRHPMVVDLNGIAKGYAVDLLAETLCQEGVRMGLVGIDGEMRAIGTRPDGLGWTVAIESPDPDIRTSHAILSLHDVSVATSGDYRHWVQVGQSRLSHTMDPVLGAPLRSPPASVTVLAQRCCVADAWATALMVMGPQQGVLMADSQGLDALYLIRQSSGEISSMGCGCFFATHQGSDSAHD